MRTIVKGLAAISAVCLFIACGERGEHATADTHSTAATGTPSATAGSPLTPAPGRKVITIEMTTDAQGNNKFSPNDFEAHQGDVLRFTLGSGVHNVHFLADSNPTLTNPPAASPLLQLPGQTYDIAVDFPEGRYYFQCDPHALLGMMGHLKVEKE